MRASRLVGLLLAVCVSSCTGPGTVVPPVPLPAETTVPAAARPPSRITDVNCDGVPDIVFGTVTAVAADGAPWRAGSVTVRYGASDQVQVVDQLALGDQPAEAGGRFGGSVVAGDLNRDGCSDVVVGDAEAGMDAPVWALWGSPDGIGANHATRLLSGEPGLGYQLAFVPLPSPVLVVGSNDGPRLYPVAADGTLGTYRLLALKSRTRHGDFPDDSYGEALSSFGDLLVVSSPQYDDEGAGFGGEVWVVRLLPGLEHRATWIGQDSPGVPGSYRLGDGFGLAVSLFDGYLAIGEPGARRRGVAGSGRVHLFRVKGSTGAPRVTYLRSIDADSARVDTSLPRAQFGNGVMVYRPCEGAHGVLVQIGSQYGGPAWALSVPIPPTGECEARVVANSLTGWAPIGISRRRLDGTSPDSALAVTTEGDLLMLVGNTTTGVPLDEPAFTVLAPAAA